MRVFIALEVPPPIKTLLASYQEPLRAALSGIRWVAPENIHITLKFLGEIPAHRLDKLTQAIETASQNMPPISLTVQGLGGFPHVQRIKVIWSGIGGDLETLRQLHSAVQIRLETLGYAAGAGSFTPHLTLRKIIKTSNWGELATWQAQTLNVMESTLTPQGAVYTPLAQFELKE